MDKKYELLKEGINDVGIFKAVFMAGGPGSGKSAVANKLALQAMGLKNVNSDVAFETGLKKANLSLKMPSDEEEQRNAVRDHAKALTAKQEGLYLKGRLGLIVDSTARDVKKVIEQNKLLKKLGYETAMVFVNTELETALDRNRQRARSIPDKIVKDSHATVRANMGKLQTVFGRRNFFIIDNDGDMKDLERNTTKMYSRVKTFTSTLPDNKMVNAWKTALTMDAVDLAAETIPTLPTFDEEVTPDQKDAIDDLLKYQFRRHYEGVNTDRIKKQHDREDETSKREKETDKEKEVRDRERDDKEKRIKRDRERASAVKRDQDQKRNEASDSVLATKEKIYKDLKKRTKFFKDTYGDKYKEVMHGTAMNMAKKQHEVAEGNYTTELSRQLAIEALNMTQRRAIGMRMRRMAKKMAKKRLRNKKRMKSKDQLVAKANKWARDKLAKKMTGGKSLNTLPIAMRVSIGKKLDNKQAAIKKLAKKMLPKVRKGEVERLKRFRQQQAEKK